VFDLLLCRRLATVSTAVHKIRMRTPPEQISITPKNRYRSDQYLLVLRNTPKTWYILRSFTNKVAKIMSNPMDPHQISTLHTAVNALVLITNDL